MVLFAVIDIIGSIPIVISLREKAGHIQSGKASLVAAFIMIAFLFLGEKILALIGIDVNSFAVAGSFVIFFLALEMILGINIIRKIFGIILLAIAVKLFAINASKIVV